MAMVVSGYGHPQEFFEGGEIFLRGQNDVIIFKILGANPLWTSMIQGAMNNGRIKMEGNLERQVTEFQFLVLNYSKCSRRKDKRREQLTETDSWRISKMSAVLVHFMSWSCAQ